MIKIVCEEGIGLEKWKNKRWISEKKNLKIQRRQKVHKQWLNAKTRSRKAKFETDFKNKTSIVKKKCKR